MKKLHKALRQLMANNDMLRGYSIDVLNRYENKTIYELKLKIELSGLFLTLVRANDAEYLTFFVQDQAQEEIEELLVKHGYLVEGPSLKDWNIEPLDMKIGDI